MRSTITGIQMFTRAAGVIQVHVRGHNKGDVLARDALDA